MGKLRIAMITPEAAPLVRSGGLGDVMGALPAAIAESGGQTGGKSDGQPHGDIHVQV